MFTHFGIIMVKYKRNRRPSQKRGRYKRRRLGRRSIGTIRAKRAWTRKTLYSMNPIPNTRVTRHKYVTDVDHPAAVGAGLNSVYAFSCNSTYDPDYTGIGHQPFMRDQMAALYAGYTVLRATIKVTFPTELIVTDATDAKFLYHGLVVNDEPTLNNYPQNVCEAHSATITNFGVRNKNLVLTATYNAAKIWKSTNKAIMADDSKLTEVGSNPSKQFFFVIWRGPGNFGDTIAAKRMHVEITYTVAWRNPLDISGS